MKKFKSISSLFALTALFAMVFIVGCQKEAMVENPDTADVQKVDANTAYIIGPYGVQQMGMDALHNMPGESLSSESNSGISQVNAHFSIQPGFGLKEGTFQLNVIKNNQGLSGSGTGSVTQIISGVVYEYQVIVKPACLSSNGEEAVVTGEITKIIGNAPELITLGRFISIKVIDNGKEKNAPADQYNPLIVVHDICDQFPLGSFFWNLAPNSNVLNASDYINVD